MKSLTIKYNYTILIEKTKIKRGLLHIQQTKKKFIKTMNTREIYREKEKKKRVNLNILPRHKKNLHVPAQAQIKKCLTVHNYDISF